MKEGKPADKFLQQVDDDKSPLDHARWKRCGIIYLIVIAPSDLDSFQAYLLDEAKECHYEEWMWRVIQSIPGTNVTILYYAAKEISTKCAHGTVINSQSHLSPFTETIDSIDFFCSSVPQYNFPQAYFKILLLSVSLLVPALCDIYLIVAVCNLVHTMIYGHCFYFRHSQIRI